MTTHTSSTRPKKTASTNAPRILEWSYTTGPMRRSWRWYVVVLTIGLGLAELFYAALRDGWSAALGMLIWTCMALASALVPSREDTAQLDGQLLYVWYTGRSRTAVERNLSTIATFRRVDDPGDRLNPPRSQLILQPSDGTTPIELPLSDDPRLNSQIHARIAAHVAPAADVAPPWWQRLGMAAERLMGWR